MTYLIYSDIKIISGGQTGVDRGALDAALRAGVACGGSCPKGRRAEDGRIADRYPLIELQEQEYRFRTLRNVLDSDGTVVIYYESLVGGTELTALYCREHSKPSQLVDAQELSIDQAAVLVHEFVFENKIHVLNVAGPRASQQPSAYDYTFAVLMKFFNQQG